MKENALKGLVTKRKIVLQANLQWHLLPIQVNTTAPLKEIISHTPGASLKCYRDKPLLEECLKGWIIVL